MSLDLDGILNVKATEKRTRLTKRALIRDVIKPPH